MRPLLAIALLCGPSLACRPSPDAAPASPKSDNLGTAMPEHLRCRQPSDCTVQAVCYWSTPSCVAADTMVTPKCGEDADPKDTTSEPASCGCSQGQCVVN